MSGLHGILSTRQGGQPRPRTALVVDSDFGSVHSIALALREEGLDVFEATSFQEGKFLWSTQSPDILVVDIRLGQFNGLQLLMRARSDRPDISAIITSSFADPVLEAETRRFGGVFMIKPVDVRSVLETVRGVAAAPANPPTPANPVIIERRQADRRVLPTPDFVPEQRVADRRDPTGTNRRTPADRAQGGISGYLPERRKGDRRSYPR
jgi:two-component system response regulator RegA